LRGEPALLTREVMDVLVAGMTAEHVLERLTEGVAVITPGDRSDVLLAVVSAHAAEGFPSLSCVILNGGLELHPSISSLVSGLGLRLPIITTRFGTFETASRVASARGRVTASSQQKVDTAIALMDTHVDLADLLARLAIPIPSAGAGSWNVDNVIEAWYAAVNYTRKHQGDFPLTDFMDAVSATGYSRSLTR